MASGNGSLNESQARRLRITCQHIDGLLSGIEAILSESESGTAFPRYSSDITPAQRRTIEDHIARVRAQLVKVLDGKGIPRDPPSVPASRAIAFTVVSIEVAVEELKPKYMKGYGPVSASGGRDLNKISGELHGLMAEFERYLAGGR